MKLNDSKKTLLLIFIVGLIHGMAVETYKGTVYRTPGSNIFSAIGIGIGVMLISWIFLKWKSPRAAWICCAIAISLSWVDILSGN